jgi:hypothetical protein
MSEKTLGKIWDWTTLVLGIFMLLVSVLLLTGGCYSDSSNTPKEPLPSKVAPILR